MGVLRLADGLGVAGGGENLPDPVVSAEAAHIHGLPTLPASELGPVIGQQLPWNPILPHGGLENLGYPGSRGLQGETADQAVVAVIIDQGYLVEASTVEKSLR